MSERTEAAIQSTTDDDLVLAECDYYQGVGFCSFDCWEQPDCWKLGPDVKPDWHPMKWANMRGRRIGYRTRNWLGWVRLAAWTWEREHPDEPHAWKGEDVSHLRRTPVSSGGEGSAS